ncbi:MAG TPA: type II toxin-antitoxin system HicA family toxin [Pyrinomonadaceae bacterium]|jgi:predicted RNA binding protein YcfA (HicA-like mRNA interferase family)|nr:type II toxin-antitoxin system HicA family toxin [Pyrinomonadaceae bacterium]
MQRRKLIERLKNHPKGVTFDDIRRLLLHEGFDLDHVTGSHHIFKKSGMTFVIPVHGNRVKSVYVRRLIELIEKAEEKSK